MNGAEATHMNKPTLIDVIEAVDITALSREDQAAAIVRGTISMHTLMNDTVCSVILGQVGKSDFEQAIAATYYQATLLLRAIATLEDPARFQIVNSAARTVFELVLDLKGLFADPGLAEKFFAFARVFKFQKATQLVSFLNDNPSIDRSRHQHAINFASDLRRKQEVEQQCIQHWGVKKNRQPNWPDHWSGKTINIRAHEAGLEFEEMYRSQFFLQSQYVHAGPSGIQDLSRDALICSFGIAHRLVQQLAATATELVGDQFHLFDTNIELRDRLRKVSAVPGYYAVESVLQKQQVTTEDLPNQLLDIGG